MKPGVLTDEDILKLINEGNIKSGEYVDIQSNVQPNSIDLTLSGKAYKLRSSFLPRTNEKIDDILSDLVAYSFNLASDEGGVLEKGITYLVELREFIKLNSCNFFSNPKSSIGRLDVLVRLISENNSSFDRIASGFEGNLYVEITPLSFPIRVRSGDSLIQGRFISGNPILDKEQLELLNKYQMENNLALLYDSNGNPIKNLKMYNSGLVLTADLSEGTIVYRSKRNTTEIDLSKRDYDPEKFFQIERVKDGKIIINPNEFILIPGKEFISIPQQEVCAEMVAIDLGIGSFRSHYAGFFDSGFGFRDIPKTKDEQLNIEDSIIGNQPTLEIRAYDVPFRITDGQDICHFLYYFNKGVVLRPYGEIRGSNYLIQKGVKLPKYFET